MPPSPIEALFAAERKARIERNLPPDHVLDISQYPFAFAEAELAAFERATQEWVERDPRDANSRLNHAMAALARKDIARANADMEQFQRLDPNDPRGRMRFGHVPPPCEHSLPTISGTYPPGPSLFISCDRAFFKNYASVLVRSLVRHAKATPVHIHLMDNDPALTERIRGFPLPTTCTWEDPTEFIAQHGIDHGQYCGAARLVRFADALDFSSGPLLMVDADCLVTGDVRPLLQSPSPAVGLRVRPGRIEPWHQFSACFVLGSAEGRLYFRRVADIIAADLTYAWWGMDQYALFSAALGVGVPIALVGPDLAAVDANRPGLFWHTAGIAKKTLHTDGTAYARAYRMYAGLPEPQGPPSP